MASEKKVKGVLVNLSQEQYDDFKKFCDDKGAKMASYVRQMIFQAMKEESIKKGETHNDK